MAEPMADMMVVHWVDQLADYSVVQLVYQSAVAKVDK